MSPGMLINKFMNRIMRYTPNVVAMAGVGSLAVLGGMMAGIGLGRFTKPLNEAGQFVSKSLNDRNKEHDKAYTALEKQNTQAKIDAMDQEVLRAQEKASAAEKIAPKVIEAAQERGKRKRIEEQMSGNERVINKKAATDAQVIAKKTEGEVHVIDKKTELDLKEVSQNTRHLLQQQKVDHQTNMTKMLGEHFSVMKKKTGQLADSVESATNETEAYISTADRAQQSIMKLTTAGGRAIQAHAELNKLLDLHEEQMVQGEAKQETAEAVQKAIINVIRTEEALDSQIKISEITSKSELRQDIAKEFGAEHRKLDSWLAGQAKETLSTLAETARKEGAASEALSGFSKKVAGMMSDALSSNEILEKRPAPPPQ